MSVRGVLGLAALAAGGYWLFLQLSGAGPRRVATNTRTSTGSSTNTNTPNYTVFTPAAPQQEEQPWWKLFVNGLQPVSSGGASNGGSMSYEKAYNARGRSYEPVIRAAATRHGVPVDILMRLAWAESTFNPSAQGPMTQYGQALGMFQFIPSTAESLGVDPLDVNSAADGAARYLARLHGRFGSWPLALAAYNWGEGNLNSMLTRGYWGSRRSTSIPSETIAYVDKIMGVDLVATIRNEQQERGLYA